MRCLLSFQACLVGLLLHVDLVLPKKIQTRQFKLNAASRFRFDDVGAVVAIWLPTAWGNPRWTSQHPVQVGGGNNTHYGFRLRPQTVRAFVACVRGYRLTHPKQHLSPSCYRFCYHKPLLDWQAKPGINSRQTDFSETTIYDGVL